MMNLLQTTRVENNTDSLPPPRKVDPGWRRPEILKTQRRESTFILTVIMSLMISDALHIPLPSRTWCAASVSLSTASLLQPLARVCDIYGCRQVFIYSQLWMTVWSIVGGCSSSGIMLIGSRAMQGVGCAASLPAGMALLGHIYQPGPRKNVVFALYGAFASIGFYLGILAGAVAAEYIGWRWYFWIGACINIIIGALGWLSIPNNLSDTQENLKVDWWGVLTIVPGLVLVVFAFIEAGNAPNGWRSSYIITTISIGGCFLLAAAYTQGWVSEQPLLPPELFKVRYMKRLTATLFCSYGAFGIYLYYATSYIQNVLKITPLMTAVWFTPLVVGGVCLAVGGGLIMHFVPGKILMIISCLGFSTAMLLFTRLPSELSGGTYWAFIFPAMIGCTIGVDITFNVTNVFITTSTPSHLQATASGLIIALLSLGIAFWLGMIEIINSVAGGYPTINTDSDLQSKRAFWTGLGLSILSLCFTLCTKIGKASAE